MMKLGIQAAAFLALLMPVFSDARTPMNRVMLECATQRMPDNTTSALILKAPNGALTGYASRSTKKGSEPLGNYALLPPQKGPNGAVVYADARTKGQAFRLVYHPDYIEDLNGELHLDGKAGRIYRRMTCETR